MADERVIPNLECSFYAGWNVHLDLDLNRRHWRLRGATASWWNADAKLAVTFH
jgi:hypothetical protein